jgi:hypothetical protein
MPAQDQSGFDISVVAGLPAKLERVAGTDTDAYGSRCCVGDPEGIGQMRR